MARDPPRALRLSLIVHRRKVECRMAKLFRNSNCRIVAVSLTIFFADLATRADNWPAWRGPHGSGISAESSVPILLEHEPKYRLESAASRPGKFDADSLGA